MRLQAPHAAIEYSPELNNVCAKKTLACKDCARSRRPFLGEVGNALLQLVDMATHFQQVCDHRFPDESASERAHFL
jgi:hypothetical protein